MSAIHPSLNSVPIDTVDAAAIERFCALQREEDIDLDYKEDWPTDLDALMAAFANTQGGLVLIGVAEDGKSRKPKLPIQGVEGAPADLRQRVLNMAFDAIFPPVLPEIAVVPIAGSRAIVMIRVSPSRLMHAVDRRSRVYVRVADSKRGHALADLSALEWLWSQRATSVNLRETIQSTSEARASSGAIPWTATGDSDRWHNEPLLIIHVTPLFPTSVPSLSPREVLDVANSLHQLRSPWRMVDVTFPWNPLSWRTVSGGVCLSSRGPSPQLQYAELGQLGSLFAAFHSEARTIGEPPTQRCIPAYGLLARLDLVLRYAAAFTRRIGFRSPTTIRCILQGAQLTRLFYKRPGQSDPFDRDWITAHLPDSTVSLIDTEVAPDAIEPRRNELVLAATRALFWAYGLGWSNEDTASWHEALSRSAPA